jgi:hypothetical protein
MIAVTRNASTIAYRHCRSRNGSVTRTHDRERDGHERQLEHQSAREREIVDEAQQRPNRISAFMLGVTNWLSTSTTSGVT